MVLLGVEEVVAVLVGAGLGLPVPVGGPGPRHPRHLGVVRWVAGGPVGVAGVVEVVEVVLHPAAPRPRQPLHRAGCRVTFLKTIIGAEKGNFISITNQSCVSTILLE